MRLSREYSNAIKNSAVDIFGKNVKVYLFGSRVEDGKKGGDIDLFIEPIEREDLVSKKMKYLARLNVLLGEQKIDLVIAKDKSRPIEIIARKGVLL